MSLKQGSRHVIHCRHALLEKPKSEAGELDREEVAKKGFGLW